MLKREIKGHEVEGESVRVRVLAVDAPQEGGACHQYKIEREDQAALAFLNFHRGPIEEGHNYVNGITHESLLVILADRLRGFQAGPFACKENAIALKKIEEALEALKTRTQKRLERQVEGTLVA